GGGWTVRYFARELNVPFRQTRITITARRVIVAAGGLGTNELLLRSKARGGVPNLSAKLGEGFSTNGDFIPFLEKTKEPVNLTRGPVQTSVAQFNDQQGENNALFHIVEDQGIPKTLSSAVTFGVPLIRSLTYHSRLALWCALIRAGLSRAWGNVLALFRNASQRQEFFRSEEELSLNMMCITASGRAQVKGKFRLGSKARETPLRVVSMDKDRKKFHEDPIFKAIGKTLNGEDGKGGLAKLLRPEDGETLRFSNPFLSDALDKLEAKSVTITHPLGGCAIGKDETRGV